MLEGWQADAYRHLKEAREYQKQGNYTQALEEARCCVELLSKDLLNTSEIKFKKIHDVSKKIPEILGKLKQPPSPAITDEGVLKRDLTWLMVLSKALTAIKSFLNYGEPRFGLGKQDIFSFDNRGRGRELAEVTVKITEETCDYINTVLEEKKAKIGMLKNFSPE